MPNPDEPRDDSTKSDKAPQGPVPGASPKTLWDKGDILLRAFATPLTVALVGFWTSSYLNHQQMTDSNYRAFAGLVSQREEADTNLRKDMFKTVLESFLKPQTSTVSDQLLKLEILAYNFHDSLDLGPIFQDVLRRVHADTDEGREQVYRLTKVANDVIFKQVEALKTEVGAGADGRIDFEAVRKDPNLYAIDQVLNLRLPDKQQTAEHPQRRFRVQVLSRNLDRKELHLRLIVSAPAQIDPGAPPEVDVDFTLGFFAFPDINNTRLSNGERCALVLTRMENDLAEVGLVYFPANRASLRDRMYVEELLHEMLHLPQEDRH